MLAVDAAGQRGGRGPILAILALHLGVDLVAVTTMTNLGFHQLMDERGFASSRRTWATATCSRRSRREGGTLGGEQSGHVVWLDGHTSGDGLVAALLLARAGRDGPEPCRAGRGHAALPQAKRNVPVRTKYADRRRSSTEVDG